jgi:hypothetical protein
MRGDQTECTQQDQCRTQRRRMFDPLPNKSFCFFLKR